MSPSDELVLQLMCKKEKMCKKVQVRSLSPSGIYDLVLATNDVDAVQEYINMTICNALIVSWRCIFGVGGVCVIGLLVLALRTS